MPSRASMETTTRSLPCSRQTSRTMPGSRTAAVPMTTRSTPASSHARAVAALRMPPPTCTGMSSAATMAEMIFQVRRRSGSGPVQVHHVQPRASLLLPA